MGRQINVELHALKAAGCELDFWSEVIEHQSWDELEAPAQETIDFVMAYMPGHSIVLSVYGIHGIVDCRGPGSPNHWFEVWLVDNKVLYLEG